MRSYRIFDYCNTEVKLGSGAFIYYWIFFTKVKGNKNTL